MYVETFFGYTSFAQGVQLSQDNGHQTGNAIKAAGITPVMTREEAVAMQDFVRNEVEISLSVAEYITRLIFATRPASRMLKSDGVLYEKHMPLKWRKTGLISYGCSSRSLFMLPIVAKAEAALHGRTQVTDADVKAVAPACLPLKLTLNEQVEMGYPLGTNREIILDLLEEVPT
jgi:MoxR-like ATPase